MDMVCSKQAAAQLSLSKLKASHLQPWSRKNTAAWTENSSHFSSERLLYFKETININTTAYNKKIWWYDKKKSYRTVYVMGTQKELKPLPSFSPHKFQGDQDKLTTSVCSCTVLFVPVLACFQNRCFHNYNWHCIICKWRQ